MNSRTKDLVYVAIYVALAVVLDIVKEYIGFLDMPSGGSINIALIPIVVASFHMGWKKGVVVAATWWLLSSILGLNSNIVGVMQYILDYVVSSLVIGAAAIFAVKKRNIWTIELGIVVTMLIRTFAINLSGAYFWLGDSVAAGSQAAWVGSLAYNLPYCIATMVMLMIIVPIIVSRIKVKN